MEEKDIATYAFEPEAFTKLRAINKRLYGDGKPLTTDERRDLANMMFVVLDNVTPLSNEDVAKINAPSTPVAGNTRKPLDVSAGPNWARRDDARDDAFLPDDEFSGDRDLGIGEADDEVKGSWQ